MAKIKPVDPEEELKAKRFMRKLKLDIDKEARRKRIAQKRRKLERHRKTLARRRIR